MKRIKPLAESKWTNDFTANARTPAPATPTCEGMRFREHEDWSPSKKVKMNNGKGKGEKEAGKGTKAKESKLQVFG